MGQPPEPGGTSMKKSLHMSNRSGGDVCINTNLTTLRRHQNQVRHSVAHMD